MGRVYRVYRKTVSVVDESATAMYENLAGSHRGFLLESYDKNYDRYTFMGVEPEERISSKGQSLVIERRDGSRLVRPGSPLEELKKYYDSFEIRNDYADLAFTGGLVGCLGYDFVRYSEALPDENPEEIGAGEIELMLMTEFLVIDTRAETLTAVVLEADDAAGRQRALARAEELVRIVRARNREPEENFVHDGEIVKRSDTREEYGEKVEKIRSYIREGHVFQTVLSQRWTIRTGRDGFSLYRELREKNPSPYLYYLNFGDFEVIGSSPEMLVKRQGRLVQTCPIAGTRRRGRDEKEEEALLRELTENEKERAEHVMLVDLARNDMGRIAEFGTVKVTRFMDVQKYSHVMHLVSLVEGKKREACHPLDLVASFLPAGTLSGAPKIRAMEIIDELETVRRGLYGGATGYLDFNGNLDFCITIRTMIKKGRDVFLQAGAGIVADSQPDFEYRECCNKGRALSETLLGEREL